jgi:hypothetical protein
MDCSDHLLLLTRVREISGVGISEVRDIQSERSLVKRYIYV